MLSSKTLYCEKKSNGLFCIGVPVKINLYLHTFTIRYVALLIFATGFFILLLSSQMRKSGFHAVSSFSIKGTLS